MAEVVVGPKTQDRFFLRLRSAWYGATLPLQAAHLILKNRLLLFWSALPVILTLVLYWFLIGNLQSQARDWVNQYLLSWGWDPQGMAIWVAQFLTQMTLIILGAITFSFSATIIASPFNDFLAESTERHSIPPLAKVETSLGGQIRLVLIDVGKAMGATLATLVAILLSWIPILNLAAFVLAFLLVTFQYTSYPQTRRGVGLREGLRFLWKHLFACAGFGAVISFLFAIPLISSLALPLAVVGGTLLVARAPGTSELAPLR